MYDLQRYLVIARFVRGITKSYKVLYLFLKNKTSYKVLYFFDRSYIFWPSLIFMSYFGCALSVCQSLYRPISCVVICREVDYRS